MASVTAYENQITGNSTEIRTHSRHYKAVAEAVAETITNLKTVTDTLDTVSKAVDAFAEIATEVATSLDEVDDRYETLAAQLEFYAQELDRFQADSATLQANARNKQDELTLASSQRQTAYDRWLTTDLSAPEATDALDLYNRKTELVEQLAGELNAYQRQLDELMDAWRVVADNCAAAINEVIDGSPLNDSWWDSFANWVETVLPDIETFLDILSIVLTVLAFLAVLTGVGAVLAPALFAIARGIQLLSKVIAVVKLVTTIVQIARGKKSPEALLRMGLDFAIDKIGGKLIDGIANRLGNGLMSTLADQVLKHSDAKNPFTSNLELIQANGFDDWIAKTLEPALNNAASGLPIDNAIVSAGKGAEGIADSIGDGLKNVKEGLGTAVLGDQTMLDLNLMSDFLKSFTGPENVLSGLGGDMFDLGKGFIEDGTGIKLSAGAHVFPDSPLGGYRPSYETLVGAAS